MAVIEALNETKICNMALGRIGASRIDDIGDNTDKDANAVLCRLHYSQTRDALIRSHWWRMARARKALSKNTAYTDDPTTFEWDNAWDLPTDFLRMKKPYEGVVSGETELIYTYSLEGTQLLSNEGSMEIRYIKRVIDPTKFDPLFVEVFILVLALKLVVPIAGAVDGLELKNDLRGDLYGRPGQRGLMAQVRTIDKEETNTTGRENQPTWNDARTVGV